MDEKDKIVNMVTWMTMMANTVGPVILNNTAEGTTTIEINSINVLTMATMTGMVTLRMMTDNKVTREDKIVGFQEIEELDVVPKVAITVTKIVPLAKLLSNIINNMVTSTINIMTNIMVIGVTNKAIIHQLTKMCITSKE